MLSRPMSAVRLLRQPTNNHQVNIMLKRWSGHNNMEITPSHMIVNKGKDILHFYVLLAAIPAAVITTIMNIRGNPELSEIPEGYEPRHWEYYKNPLTRFICKWYHRPPEIEEEIFLSDHERKGEEYILRLQQNKVEAVMRFYNDHRGRNFKPFYGEYFRKGRDEFLYLMHHMQTEDAGTYDRTYDPTKQPLVPTEGYKPTDEQP